MPLSIEYLQTGNNDNEWTNIFIIFSRRFWKKSLYSFISHVLNLIYSVSKIKCIILEVLTLACCLPWCYIIRIDMIVYNVVVYYFYKHFNFFNLKNILTVSYNIMLLVKGFISIFTRKEQLNTTACKFNYKFRFLED